MQERSDAADLDGTFEENVFKKFTFSESYKTQANSKAFLIKNIESKLVEIAKTSRWFADPRATNSVLSNKLKDWLSTDTTSSKVYASSDLWKKLMSIPSETQLSVEHIAKKCF